MKTGVLYIPVIVLFALFATSCDKGYTVGFVNYYTEPMDSVVIGNNKLVYTAIELQATTEYFKLAKGKYTILIISKTKKKFYSSITIPKTGSGKRSIQIDAIEQINILEE
jgi:hypothetical protein